VTQDRNPAGAKAAMRVAALARRAGLARPEAGQALAAHVLEQCPPPPGAVVAGFWPMGDEIDLRPLLHALHTIGHLILLPVTPRRGLPLGFHVWSPGCAMLPGRFGTSHPEAEAPSAPGFVLVPLLAFDARGHRLGYGGGYYDRTLAALPQAFRLGVAYAGQQVPHVPAAPHDIPLHAIATEAGLLRPNDGISVPALI